MSPPAPLKLRCEGAGPLRCLGACGLVVRRWALSHSFPDQEVRRMAVQWIGSLSDAELLDYLPQLVQVGGMPALRFWGPTPEPPCGLHAAPQDQVEMVVGVGDWQSL